MEKLLSTLPKNNFEEVRAALTEYKGTQLFDLRVYTNKQGEPEKVPTKKGISVNVKMLPDLAKVISAACLEAREAGLID